MYLYYDGLPDITFVSLDEVTPGNSVVINLIETPIKKRKVRHLTIYLVCLLL